MKTHNIPILYLGAPGIGKTAIIESRYEHVEKILLSTKREEDIAGKPYRDGIYERTTMPELFENLKQADKDGLTTCLFLDEIDKARQEVADTLLTLVQSRKIGRWELPENTKIIAAANPPEWGGGDGVSQAMQSRFAVIDFKPDLIAWCKWALNKFPSMKNFIDKIKTGECPLVETVGSGWNWRLTCPRTLSNAMQIIVSEEPDYIDLIYGLLTPNAASCLEMCVNGYAKEEQEISRRVSVNYNKKIMRL